MSKAIDSLDESDLVTMSLIDGRITRLTETPAAERGGMFSPDGRFIAYASNESGDWQVYVRPYPEFESFRTTVSAGGGRFPMWSRDGTELFYIQDRRRMMAVTVTTEPTFATSRPEMLFEGDFYLQVNGDQSYDVRRNGRFVMIQEGGDSQSLVVVTNFSEELNARVGN